MKIIFKHGCVYFTFVTTNVIWRWNFQFTKTQLYFPKMCVRQLWRQRSLAAVACLVIMMLCNDAKNLHNLCQCFWTVWNNFAELQVKHVVNSSWTLIPKFPSVFFYCIESSYNWIISLLFTLYLCCSYTAAFCRSVRLYSPMVKKFQKNKAFILVFQEPNWVSPRYLCCVSSLKSSRDSSTLVSKQSSTHCSLGSRRATDKEGRP